ncbi:CLUMA_CG001538, isoform A [Clunio marinus]|uniref:CLUMA_CG001538, isoform A n=1 Tax=Clunio marinus TaxID=568069 RepID=A0A1J1HK20_9DIPT|nr:CLUMA_CG001538, isoform A [Clunio marinus]
MRVEIFVFIAIISLFSVKALRCWRCSSANPFTTYCTDLFLTPEESWALVECPDAPTEELRKTHRPVCRKIKRQINNNVLVIRSCIWENENAISESCASLPKETTKSCDVCLTNGCNGESMNSVLLFHHK